MNITTKNKIKPVAERMAKGIKPTDSELQLLRAASVEVREPDFKAQLQSAGNETTRRQLRQAGNELLSAIRFATGARRRNDLPPGNVRPEKAKRMLDRGKFMK
jgi:16S rRNA U516 pseudouridylate synthase RsuA-like enzyme